VVNLPLPDQLAELLSRRAKEQGLTLLEFLEKKANELPDTDRNGHAAKPDDRAAALNSFIRSMQEWGTKHIPPGHVVDDSRESIYEGRGE
jgi:hypothetical protein